MNMPNTSATQAPTLERQAFAFTGSAGEYFKIWIVNLLLSIVTLGIFSAWAKVRSKRYFYGNTTVAGHNFEYHGNPIRILIGRLIALVLLIGYSVSIQLSATALAFWLLVLLVAVPWLIVSSLRFNARNSSYRNVRLNFHGSYWQAIKALYLWPLLALITLYTTLPLAHRAGNYFYVNNHSYGGEPLHTTMPGGKMYAYYAACLLLPLVMFIIIAIAVAGTVVVQSAALEDPEAISTMVQAAIGSWLLLIVVAYVALIVGSMILPVLIFNLAVSNMTLAGQHEFRATLSPWAMLWINFSNVVVVLLTLGLAYPWARVRLARYQFSHLELLAASDLSEFNSGAMGDMNAIGEEVAGFF
ncbi:MAG: DUF898 domain-containing protein, partial [Pseudomonadales bacterium]|nr:DUF898 domain-containing protein [Pseudomonadales bacterium]